MREKKHERVDDETKLTLIKMYGFLKEKTNTYTNTTRNTLVFCFCYTILSQDTYFVLTNSPIDQVQKAKVFLASLHFLHCVHLHLLDNLYRLCALFSTL